MYYKNLFITAIIGSLLTFGILDCKKKLGKTGPLELVSSRHGEFALLEEKVGDMTSKKMYSGDKMVYSSEPGNTFHLYQTFQLGNEDVIVFLTEKSGEKSCAKFFIASVLKGPEMEILPIMGNCHDNPEITEESGKITFQFHSTGTELSQTVVYQNRKIEVTESKLSKK